MSGRRGPQAEGSRPDAGAGVAGDPGDRGSPDPSGAVRVVAWVFRLLRVLLPARLRRRHGPEMDAMLVAVLEDARRRGGPLGLLDAVGREAADLVGTAVRTRVTGVPPVPRLAGVAGAAGLAIALALLTEGRAPPEPVVRFDAHDPAGTFTLVLRDGRVVEATLDGAPVPARRVLQRGDSVTLVGAEGRPGVRLRLERPATIHWEARPAPR